MDATQDRDRRHDHHGSVWQPCCSAHRVAPSVPAGEPSRAQDGRRSTRVPIRTPQGRLNSYVVNAGRPWAENTVTGERAVRRSGGGVVQAWPQIGVVVAHSRRAPFRNALRRRDRRRLGGRDTDHPRASRGRRAAPGPPPRAPAPGPGQGAVPPAAEARVVPDPREKAQWDMRVIKADRAHEVTDGSDEVLVGDPRQRHRPRPPRPRGQPRHRGLGQLHRRGHDRTRRHGLAPHHRTTAPTSPAPWPPPATGSGSSAWRPGRRLASVKVVNDSGLIYPEYAVCGFMWAGLQGMDVTNSSYYIDPFMFWCSDRRDQSAAKRAVARAVTWSTEQGVVHAAAAGNAATDLSHNRRDGTSPNDSRPVSRRINAGCHELPAELPGVVTVSSFARIGDTLRTRLVVLLQHGPRRDRRGRPGLGHPVHRGPRQRLRPLQRHLDGLAARGRGPRAAGRGPPGWRRRGWRSAGRAGRRHAVPPPQGGLVGRCRGTDADNSYAGEGMVDALEAVQP